MAGITTKGMYGLAAMYQLMKNNKGTAVQIKEIAEKADIPQNYLEQILVLLRRNGLVKSIRGASGGYMLAKNPEDISIFEILNTLEDGICNSAATTTSNQVLNLFWRERQKKVKETFSVTLAELSKYEQEANNQLIYAI